MRLVALTLAALIGTPAMAQDTYCGAAAGGVVGATKASRDWNLATPGPYAVDESVALSLRCSRRPSGRWIGVETTPTLRHSYDRLDGRAPLPVTASIGAQFRLGEGSIGPYFLTNRAVTGLGLRYEQELLQWVHAPLLDELSPTLDLRVARLGGTDPQYQAWVMLELRAKNIGREGPVRFAHQQLTFRKGFEIGTITGYRVELLETPASQSDDRFGVHVGARVGVLTDLPRDHAVRPIALVMASTELSEQGSLELSGGLVYDGGDGIPVMGTALHLQGEGVLAFQAGLLVLVEAEPTFALDLGVGVAW